MSPLEWIIMKRFFIGLIRRNLPRLGWATCGTLIPPKYAFINTIMRESNARKCGKVFRVPFVFVPVRFALKMYSSTQKERRQADHLNQNETKYHANPDNIAKKRKTTSQNSTYLVSIHRCGYQIYDRG